MACDYSNKLYKDYENEINKNIELENLNKTLSLRLSIAESKQQRLEKNVNKKKQIINEQNKQIEACKQEIINLKKQLDIAVYEKNNYLSKLNNDSANSGLPTSQTPINKKKESQILEKKLGIKSEAN